MGTAAPESTPTRPTPTPSRPKPSRPDPARVAAPSPSPPPSRTTVFADPDGYYTLLGFSVRTFKALPSDGDVRDARNEQLRIWHPDTSTGDTERTQRINEAYDRLATGALIVAPSQTSPRDRPLTADCRSLPFCRGAAAGVRPQGRLGGRDRWCCRRSSRKPGWWRRLRVGRGEWGGARVGSAPYRLRGLFHGSRLAFSAGLRPLLLHLLNCPTRHDRTTASYDRVTIDAGRPRWREMECPLRRAVGKPSSARLTGPERTRPSRDSGCRRGRASGTTSSGSRAGAWPGRPSTSRGSWSRS
jgi:hypothetical protein